MIGELIAELRKDLRLKQTDVAAYLGVSAGTISNYECGRYEPDLGTVRQLSRLFNVTSDYLLGLTDNKYTTLQLKRAFGSHSTLEDCLSVLQRLNKVDQKALEIVLQTFKEKYDAQGKVAIVTGDSLNKKKISDIFDKLYGGALIIEKAGKMNERTVARLNKAMEKDTGELLIVLEEQRKPIDRLLSSNREFRRKFTSRLEVPIFINDELVTFGQTYAQENGYRIDEMGILALYSKIDSLQREDHAVTVAEVKGIMDDAIQHSQKASAKKLVKRVFGKNTDESDRILLSENDFNI